MRAALRREEKKFLGDRFITSPRIRQETIGKDAGPALEKIIKD